MSVNLHLSVSVRGYEAARSAAIRQAMEAVFEVEGIEKEMSAVEESGEGAGRVLRSRSNPEYPVAVSGAYEWVPKVQEAMREAVAGANGRPCEVAFEGEDADEGREEEEEAE